MSGFQLYNSAGYLTIDSESKGTVVSKYKTMPTLSSVGDPTGARTAFGNGSTLGYLPYNFFTDMQGLRWFQFTRTNSYCFPGAEAYEVGSGRFMSTTTGTLQSGYLDVYDAAGSLVWSAAGASTMPRITDFLTIPAGYDIQSNVLSMNLSYNPWICISQAPGNYSPDPEGPLGASGFQFRWTGTQLQVLWFTVNQRSWLQLFPSNQYKIALARFQGY